MGRSNSHENMELKKGPWTREEDQKLMAYIDEHGHGSWRALPAKAGLQRCGKSCRLRWTNYLRPDIKRGKFNSQEEKTIIRLHALLGNSLRWSAIATHLPKRTDNEIKNYWNTRLKKRLTRMGIDPATHKPKANLGSSRQAAVVSHMAQWETARLEAEARLVREGKFLSKFQLFRKLTAPPPPPPPAAAAPPCLDVLKVWQATDTAHNGFFSSAGCLESPTSTLNFSGNDIRVPTIERPRGVVEGKNDNSAQLVPDDNMTYWWDYDINIPRSMEIETINWDGYNNNNNNNDNSSSVYVGDYFEDNNNYWNELLNLVTSPFGSPVL
ncbi:hypothetical protein CASFOL_009750 [Castilleja foliolosa]|uniref:Uncharacterized protein n=1 Tax=Castilleja foliolosa TaxID=1961234 RepID=A0ABD3DQQ7_9LAMI